MKFKIIAIVGLSFSLPTASLWAHHHPGHDGYARGGIVRLAKKLRWEISSRIAGDEALRAAIREEATARSAADRELAEETASAHAVATDAENRVSALESETTLSDVGHCTAGHVAKADGAGGWVCAPDVGAGNDSDTLAELGCTQDGDVAVFFGGQWVCESDLPMPPRFVDNGDGTVTDNATGLMWEQKQDCGLVANLGNPHCVANTYSWTSASDGDLANADGTLYTSFLARLNFELTSDPNASCFAGHCDWRIPNIGELQTILLGSCPGFPTPCIDEAIFGSTQALGYWSSSTFADGSMSLDSAWRVVFSSGIPLSLGKTDINHARAVRDIR